MISESVSLTRSLKAFWANKIEPRNCVWLVQVRVNQEEIKMRPAKTTGRPPSVPEVREIFIQI